MEIFGVSYVSSLDMFPLVILTYNYMIFLVETFLDRMDFFFPLLIPCSKTLHYKLHEFIFHHYFFNSLASKLLRVPECHHIQECLYVYIFSHFSLVQHSGTPKTIAHWPPLSIGFPKKEFWSGLPCSPPGVLPKPSIKPTSLKWLLHYR